MILVINIFHVDRNFVSVCIISRLLLCSVFQGEICPDIYSERKLKSRRVKVLARK